MHLIIVFTEVSCRPASKQASLSLDIWEQDLITCTRQRWLIELGKSTILQSFGYGAIYFKPSPHVDLVRR